MPKEEHKHSKHHAPKKVFDVTRPGKSTASPNSRSVIVGHKPPVADDQFVPGAASTAPTLRASDPFEKHDLMDSKKKKLVLPVSFSSPEEIASAPALPGSKDVDGDE